ncbi:MAG: hypothetical protein K0Q49_1582 [Haloplasmataceae bacterium]|jgi:uncharacterized protein (TIRG00374 family)|nr:hypothetical protein [Haloplasmataceae bacterium]
MKDKLYTYLILTLFFIVISILTILFIYKQFNLNGQASFNIMEIYSFDVLIQLFILLIIYFLLDTLRFYYILRTLNIKINFLYMIKLAFINIFVSNVTPFASGGGFAQIYFLTKKGVAVGHSTAAASIRTILPIFFFFIASPFILMLNADIRSILPNNLIISIMLILIFLVSIFLSIKVIKDTKIIKKYIYLFTKFLKNKNMMSEKFKKRIIKTLFIEIDRFAYSVKLFFTGNPKYIMSSIFCTICFLISLFMFPVILYHGLNYNELTVTSIMSMQVLITFLTYFAPTPGATGIAEGGFVTMFQNFVVNPNHLLSLTFSWRFFTIYIGLIIGLILFYQEILKKK